jgi:serine/threonine protein kinase
MNYETYYTSNKTAITVESKPFGIGGEGNIYKIITSQYKSSCIKIYHSRYITKEKEKKISYMVKNPPPKLEDTMFLLCWPKELIYNQNGSFLGFLMPLAFESSIQFFEFTNLKFKKTLRNSIWDNKFLRTTADGLQNRLKVCLNISAAVYHVHESQKYVFVDFKPQNVLINIEGKISITDLDSIQISKGNRVLYRSHVVTPEYVPKESEKYDPKYNQIHESWDRFSLAVMFYENIFGLHPYVGTTTGQYAEKNTISEKIYHNLFPLGSKRVYFSNPPKQHDHINRFPISLKMLFLRAFEYSDPQKRPNASEWGRELYSIINNPEFKKKPIVIPNDIPKQTTHSHDLYQSKPSTHSVKPQYRQPINQTTQQTKSSYNSSNEIIYFFVIIFVCICISMFFRNEQSNNSDSLTSEVSIDSTMILYDTTAFADSASITADSATVSPPLVYEHLDTTRSAYNYKSGNKDFDTPPESNGTIVFWKKCNLYKEILEVYVDSDYIGIIDDCNFSIPSCGSTGCVTFYGSAGTKHSYLIKSRDSNKTFEGELIIEANTCIQQGLTAY